jgi:hypothetical protein
METSTEMIKKILEHLVSPKWNGIVEYKIEPSTHDDTGVLYYMIDVIFDIDTYWETLYSREYGHSSEMDEDISDNVRTAVKYLGINNVIVEIYVRNEHGFDIN